MKHEEYAKMERAQARVIAHGIRMLAAFQLDPEYRQENPEAEVNAALANLTETAEECLRWAAKEERLAAMKAEAKELHAKAEKYRQLMIHGRVHGDVYGHAAGLMWHYDALADKIACEATALEHCRV